MRSYKLFSFVVALSYVLRNSLFGPILTHELIMAVLFGCIFLALSFIEVRSEKKEAVEALVALRNELKTELMTLRGELEFSVKKTQQLNDQVAGVRLNMGFKNKLGGA